MDYTELLTPAPQWAHGDYPTAAKMQVYSDTLTELHDRYPDHWLGARQVAYYRSAPGVQYILTHIHRWLFYRSTGELVDLNGVNDPVALDENINGWFGMLDLETVEWLVPGMMYEVTGINAAFEDAEPY